MSYADVVDGLHERFATVSGIGPVLDYAPTSVPADKTLFSSLDSFEIVRSGQVIAYRYRIRHRLVIYWQDNAAAEESLQPFVNSIPAAVDADPHLGARLTAGYAQITSGDAGWFDVGGTDYRYVDFYSTVLDKSGT